MADVLFVGVGGEGRVVSEEERERTRKRKSKTKDGDEQEQDKTIIEKENGNRKRRGVWSPFRLVMSFPSVHAPAMVGTQLTVHT